jgi:SsrA-binding protein
MSKQKNAPGEDSLILRNKKAFHDYEVLEKIECGIELRGTEVKSLRNRKVNFGPSFAVVNKGELFLLGLHISPYDMGNQMNHEPERKRKLLVHRRELRKLAQRIEQRGLTLVPLRLYWKRNLCKVEMGVVRGKQLHDKRDTARSRDLDRRIERETRNVR